MSSNWSNSNLKNRWIDDKFDTSKNVTIFHASKVQTLKTAVPNDWNPISICSDVSYQYHERKKCNFTVKE